jgi:hypothetical protein
MKDIKDLLGTTLPAEMVESLQEAFESKVATAIAEQRADLQAEIESDLARRFDRDRNTIIESIDAMVTDALNEQAAEREEEMNKLAEARVLYHTAMVEGKQALRNRLKESLSTGTDLIAESLRKEITALRNERSSLVEKSEKMNADLRATKVQIAEQHEAHVAKIDDFVTKQLRAELVEFAEDKQALVEQRVKLVAESREKFKVIQDRFVAEAAGKVEKFVEDNLQANLKELHEDLERNRQNMFGRRIFEAVVAEYMTSYFAEDTEVRKLQHVLESKDAEIAQAKEDLDKAVEQINESKNANEVADRKVRLAEDRAERAKISNELLANLKGDKRTVMENLLGTVKTTDLRKQFNKLLPIVLAETKSKSPTAVLREHAKPEVKAETRAVTGDAIRSNRLLESEDVQQTEDFEEIAHIKHLAGLR